MGRYLAALVVLLVVLLTLVSPLTSTSSRGPLVAVYASRDLNVYRVVFIGDDDLTLTVVSIVKSRTGEACPGVYSWLVGRGIEVRIEHYLDYKYTSPSNLSDVYFVVFSGAWLARVMESRDSREEFLVFLRELHRARGGRGGFIAFGYNTSVLFDALCLAGVGDRIGYEERANPFRDNPPVALVEFTDGVSIGASELPPEERRPGASLEERLAEALLCTIYWTIHGAVTRTPPTTTTIILTIIPPTLPPEVLTILALSALVAVAIAVVVVIIVVRVVK
jgi:hypothetical protein